MKFRFIDPKQTWSLPARLAIASLTTVVVAGGLVGVASGRDGRSIASVESRAGGEPIMAIVSLRSQQISVYDANGWILRAPVSSGQKGRETPAGIFAIIEKEAEHYSNLYDDAYMPHMERLTWSGIALHGGLLPGYPASHGCVRMPYDFAERLFETTRLGMRVIVAPRDAMPVMIAHPLLFPPKPGAAAAAAALAAEADEAASKADRTRIVAGTASREAARAMVPVRVAENLKRRAEAQLAAAEVAVASASSDEAKQQAADAQAKATARIAEVEAQLAAAQAEAQPKLDAVAPARQAAIAAETASALAADAARKAAGDLEPASIFISRKTQRLYVRQAFQPVLEVPITIRDADRPIGTHVFTAVERTSDVDMRWSVVSLERGYSDDAMRERRGANVEPKSTPEADAKAALDRIAIPRETFDRITAMVSPRSSLIISDEAFSAETGKGTEFVILMSGEPQGGIKARRHNAQIDARYQRPGTW